MANNRYLYLIKQLHNLNIYDGVVVDCGCGDGNGSKLLIENGFDDIHSFDISDEAISRCRDNGVKAQKGNITKMPLDDNFADIFICSETLEHLNTKESSVAIMKIKRICKQDGCICITVSENKEQCLKGAGHKQYFTKQDLLDHFFPLEVAFEGVFCKKPGKCNLVLIFINDK